MTKPSRGERIRYVFDNFMARGTVALILGLFVVAVDRRRPHHARCRDLLRSPRHRAQDLLWNSMMRTLDPGTMGGDSGAFGFLLGMLAVTLFGIFLISALIGIINTGLEGKLADLRKGRSRVVESGHTVILGWSQEIFTVVSELVVANENLKRSAIVILADRDKGEMDDEIRTRLPSTGRTSIVCRSGDPMDIDDLEIARLETSRSIVILSPENDDPDADVIKTMLAVTNHPRRRPEPYHIVAEMRDAANMDVARLVGGAEAQLILSGDLIARIIAQTCRQTGLSIVYTELLDFDGDEIYFASIPELVGRTFGDALLAFEDSAVIGLRPADGKTDAQPADGDGHRGGRPRHRHQPGRRHGPTVDARRRRSTKPRSGRTARTELAPERTLVLGWNRRAPTIIRELDGYVAGGSAVVVVADIPGVEAALDALRPTLANQTVRFERADTTSRAVLETLDVGSFDHIVVLCYSDSLETQRADSRTIITLLHLRDIEERDGHRHLDRVRDARPAQPRARRGDPRRRLHRQRPAGQPADGPGLRERPAQCGLRRPVRRGRFGDLPATGARISRAGRRGDVRDDRGVGAAPERGRHRRPDAGRRRRRRRDGVRINPPKSTRVTLGAKDAVIVLAE